MCVFVKCSIDNVYPQLRITDVRPIQYRSQPLSWPKCRRLLAALTGSPLSVPIPSVCLVARHDSVLKIIAVEIRDAHFTDLH